MIKAGLKSIIKKQLVAENEILPQKMVKNNYVNKWRVLVNALSNILQVLNNDYKAYRGRITAEMYQDKLQYISNTFSNFGITLPTITAENKITKDMKESKQTIKLNESQLRQVIKESIKKMLNERSLDDIEHTNLYGYDDAEDYSDEELVKVANPGDYTSAFIDYLKELIGSQADGLSLNSFIRDMRNGKIRYCEKNDGIYYINDWPGV